MSKIIFIDTEIDAQSGKILDIGGVSANDACFHSCRSEEFVKFLKGNEFICGHNILNHDLKYIREILDNAGINASNAIDTLHLSPLLFPAKPYHALLKDDKLQSEDLNNPLNDAIKSKNLFDDELAAYHNTDAKLQEIYNALLRDSSEFSAFFKFISASRTKTNIEAAISKRFKGLICKAADIKKIASEYPVETAYCLALINARDRYSITPPWVLKNYPAVSQIIHLLRHKSCLLGCAYCNEVLDIFKSLKRTFGFDRFRTYNGEPLQERAVKAAVDDKSFLVVFPTGGGKSVTFQLPALMSATAVKGLTVVISPLQSLMKDQVDNLEKINITDAVTINGLLDPIERAKSFERTEDGQAGILYISPESLRSKSVERLILSRNVVRFVIDEAHCFSSWGQDFRVDYLYIGDFIKNIMEKKGLNDPVPVSCFTATAKPKVILDIQKYFKDKLSLELEVFRADSTRENLHYRVFDKGGDQDKYQTIRELLISKNCPTIIYVSRTKKAFDLASKLCEDGFSAKPYHGKMNSHEKTENQDAFIKGEVQIIVATSAFGMGVDKKDVGMVIHNEISDSLENYVQEAGRAGRDESITADCYVLYNDEDLSKHFVLLNRTKLSLKEIQQVWKAIKELTRFRSKISQSALEIARQAGWDDSISDIESRVKTAIAALEEAGYLKRGQNMPRIFADSILTKNAMDAISKISASDKFNEKEKMQATRIIKKLFSSRSRKHAEDETGECRVDHISDHLGIEKEEVIHIINLLREERILANAKDLTAYIRQSDNENRSIEILKLFEQIELMLAETFDMADKIYNVKELNELAASKGIDDVTPNHVKKIINFWSLTSFIKRSIANHSANHMKIAALYDRKTLSDKLLRRHMLARFIVDYLYEQSRDQADFALSASEGAFVEFSVLEILENFDHRMQLLKLKTSTTEVEDTIFYLSRIDALRLEGGFLVVYNGLSIERIELDNKKRYNKDHYQKLEQFYQSKIQQIHIVGEYARKMLENYKDALKFVDDYFRLNYQTFLNKYFKGGRLNEINRNITPSKFRKLFGELSPSQLKIINDQQAKTIVVAAGPGSGKTRILVHKLASLLLMEDVKHDQLLMLTFSRAAATEFKKRLMALIGGAAGYIEIKTFHSYCFDLLGRVGTLEKSDDIIKIAIERIKEGSIEPCKITKTVLVIDEAQDMDANEFALIQALMECNEDMRVIAVGDDDQNIFEFRGSSAKYLHMLLSEKCAVIYELNENYRSKPNLCLFTNQFIMRLPHRLKQTPIVAVQKDNGYIKVVRYKSVNLILPFVQDILASEYAGTTGVLVKSNEEALKVNSLLLQNGMNSRLIQSNEGFNLYNLQEIRFFLDRLNLYNDHVVISDEAWHAAKLSLADRFSRSLNYEVCVNLINAFEGINPKCGYKSDLSDFIRESKLEDFFSDKTEALVVSTIHKAKGREFDNVFLLLDQFYPSTDEEVRQLYVAMTRAKNTLIIHYNGSFLESIRTDNLERQFVQESYPPPSNFPVVLNHRDVWLEFSKNCQRQLEALISGATLGVDSEGCLNSDNKRVVRFSKFFIKKLAAMKESKYEPKIAKVRYMVFWKNENCGKEIKILLPEVYFERAL